MIYAIDVYLPIGLVIILFLWILLGIGIYKCEYKDEELYLLYLVKVAFLCFLLIHHCAGMIDWSFPSSVWDDIPECVNSAW